MNPCLPSHPKDSSICIGKYSKIHKHVKSKTLHSQGFLDKGYSTCTMYKYFLFKIVILFVLMEPLLIIQNYCFKFF
jgi:hypothetical protein